MTTTKVVDNQQTNIPPVENQATNNVQRPFNQAAEYQLLLEQIKYLNTEQLKSLRRIESILNVFFIAFLIGVVGAVITFLN